MVAGRSPASETLSEAVGLLGWSCTLSRRAGRLPSAAERSAHGRTLATNLPILAAVEQAASALRAAGIDAIAYKGQDYLHRLYADVGARPMADADLLVRPWTRKAAARALSEAGFVADPECPSSHECKFVRDGVAVDLHWGLLQEGRMRPHHGAFFERAVPSPLAPGLLAFEATDALLVHCINQLVKGYCLPAHSYVESSLLLAGADRARLLSRAHQCRALSAVYCSMRALDRLGHRSAADVLECIALSPARRAFLDRVVERFALETLGRPPPARLTLLLLKGALVDRSRDAIAFLGRWLDWQLQLAGLPSTAAETTRGSLAVR
ncbi:MAG: nucleotidyltransferase family protein [Myxococcales bacterium]|nr:nucleotidyltransferase family protein [Myxococcales bacterium]